MSTVQIAVRAFRKLEPEDFHILQALEQQMKNCYSDLEKVLKHYNCSFDDVVVENVFTTNMPKFLEFAGYRTEIYKKHLVKFVWVKGHANNPLNERCDQLAVEASFKGDLLEDTGFQPE